MLRTPSYYAGPQPADLPYHGIGGILLDEMIGTPGDNQAPVFQGIGKAPLFRQPDRLGLVRCAGRRTTGESTSVASIPRAYVIAGLLRGQAGILPERCGVDAGQEAALGVIQE